MSLREPSDQFCGDRNAGVVDPFGFQGWNSTYLRDISAEEMKIAATEQKTA